jgi:SAM-dependent methyltransferase
MLAPRKTLWSTPYPVLETVVSWIDLHANDVVCDVGCGDGRVIIHLASKQSLPVTFVGIEIDADRARQAQEKVKESYDSGRIPSYVKVTIHCANVVDVTHLYKHATVFFLYLIPRGLRLMYPILKRIATNQQTTENKPVTVITYMSPLPNEPYIAKEECSVKHHPEAAWLLYLYRLYPHGNVETTND